MEWFDAYRYDDVTLGFIEVIRKMGKDMHEEILECDKNASFPTKMVQEMAKIFLFGCSIPKRYGGAGCSMRQLSVIARELAYISGGLHLIWTANSSLAAFPIIYAGTRAQKKKYLPRIASGDIFGCFMLTEPGAGSDAASLETRATKKDGGWVLKGEKRFITNALLASVGIVFARTGEGKHDISAFIVDLQEAKQSGSLVVKKTEKRSLKSSDFCSVFFDNVSMLEDSLLGGIHKGFSIAMATLDNGRINIAAQAIGMAASIFDEALEEAKDREQFGKKIWENQALQFSFAAWYAELLSSWAAIDEASRIAMRMKKAGKRITIPASVTKLVATERALDVAVRACRVFGGSCITNDLTAVERTIGILNSTLYEGSSEMQKTVLARFLSE
ncbi:MAG: acyl-CoA dehydrogenase family protein [bacterium]|nr:acyl-CoA dehydrogenase family protein [bacterium]